MWLSNVVSFGIGGARWAGACVGSWIVAAAILATPAAAVDAPCGTPLASLPIDLGGGLATVSASIDGEAARLILDTGGSFSMMSAATAHRFGLELASRHRAFGTVFGGILVRQSAHADSVSLAAALSIPIDFAIVPDGVVRQGSDGVLGGDMLSGYDLEIDFAEDIVRFYRQDGCSGLNQRLVAQWSDTPLLSARGHHVLVAATLDGQAVTAALDTGAQKTSMSSNAARRIFGSTGNDAASAAGPAVSVNGLDLGPARHRPIRSLDIAGLSFKGIDVQLLDGDITDPHGPELLIGLDLLRRLHVVIAYGDHRLYVSKFSGQ